MTRGLEHRTKFLLRARRKKQSLPWLRHKYLQLQLWTAAYMLDTWEAAVVMMLVPLLTFGLLYALGWSPLTLSVTN
jgi:hypothetical protein